MRTKRKVVAIIDDNFGILGDLSHLLSASDTRRLCHRGHHLDSDALYLDSQRLSDPCAQRFGAVAQARRPRRAHDADGELSVLKAGAGDRFGEFRRQGGADVGQYVGSGASSAFECGEPIAPSRH